MHPERYALVERIAGDLAVPLGSLLQNDAEVERIDVTEVSEKLVEEGLVNIEIIKGTAKISDENVSQLRNTAINLITDRVKEILLHKIRGMTEEERRSSLMRKVTEEADVVTMREP